MRRFACLLLLASCAALAQPDSRLVEDLVAANRILAALGGTITYLDPEETRLVEEREGHGLKRAWEAWKRNALGN